MYPTHLRQAFLRSCHIMHQLHPELAIHRHPPAPPMSQAPPQSPDHPLVPHPLLPRTRHHPQGPPVPLPARLPAPLQMLRGQAAQALPAPALPAVLAVLALVAAAAAQAWSLALRQVSQLQLVRLAAVLLSSPSAVAYALDATPVQPSVHIPPMQLCAGAAGAAGFMYLRRRKAAAAGLVPIPPPTKPQDLQEGTASDQHTGSGGGSGVAHSIPREYDTLPPVTAAMLRQTHLVQDAAPATPGGQAQMRAEGLASAAQTPFTTDAAGPASQQAHPDSCVPAAVAAAAEAGGAKGPGSVAAPATGSLGSSRRAAITHTSLSGCTGSDSQLLSQDPLLSLLASRHQRLGSLEGGDHVAHSSGGGGAMHSEGSVRTDGAGSGFEGAHMWKVEWSSISFHRVIGEGSFGKVSAGWHCKTLPKTAPPSVLDLTLRFNRSILHCGRRRQ